MSERRRLPVLQSAPSKGPGDDDPDAIDERPPWHWVGFGAVAIFATWLPLAYVAQSLGERAVKARFEGVDPEEVVRRINAMSTGEHLRLFGPLAAMHVLALGLGALAGGYLVGRFGSGTTVREPALAGLVVALMAVVLSMGRSGVSGALLSGVVIVLVAVGGAALGGKRGLAKKDKGAPVAPSV